MSSIAVVDIGNTSVTVGVARAGRVIHVARLPGKLMAASSIRSVIRAAVGLRGADGSCLCSVVPRATRVWAAQLTRVVGSAPLVVTHRLKLGVGVKYAHPATIGADRLANACGATARYGYPVIVADFGTALTFDVVDANGMYIGGVISPGLPFVTEYLAEKTALLPRIKLTGVCSRVGRSTAGAMRIGAKVGYRGMVREITTYLVEGLGGGGEVKLCATGGFAEWALEGLDMPYEIAPDLTLYGLSRIYDLNAVA